MNFRKLVLSIAFIFLTLTMLSNGFQAQAVDKPDYFFSVHLVAPTSNPVRMQFSQLMEEEIAKIGIGTELDLVSWAALGPRCTDQEVGMYSQGGYDICFFGMSLGTAAGHPGDSMQGVYGSGAIPPQGFNVPYWSPVTGQGYNNYRAQESDDLISEINTNLDVPSALPDLYEWQTIWYDAMPNIIIYNQYEVHAISSDLFGYDPVGYPLGSIESQWFTSDKDTVVLAVSTGPRTFNSIQATDVYSQYSAGQPMDALVGNTPSTETVLPTGTVRNDWMTDNYGTTVGLALYPRMATSLGAFSEDGLQFNISVRDDIYWHDGVKFDAWDVAFSYQARLVPAIGASVYSNLLVPFGTDNKTAMSGNYSFVVEDKDSDGFFESISFQFVDTFAPWMTDYLGSLIYPEHILGDPANHGFDGSGDFQISQWLVQPTDWSTHSTSTGRTTDTGGYAGPIGTGSQVFKSYDGTTGIVTLEKFENLMWSGSAWVANATNDHYLVKDGGLTDMPQTATIITTSLDSAIADMKDGDINIIDPQFTMASVLEELQASAAIQPVLSPETGWQSLYMNPKFVQDGVYHFQKKGVNHAISHVVPRNDIINYLMNGLGVPGYTPVPITSWAAIPEADMLAYKKTLEATDGSTPEADATTAYDEYSLELAFDWLDTEEYDTTAWREYAASLEGGTGAPGFEFVAATLSMLGVALFALRRRR
jgi:ABC-type transport system substrate-binding protein